MSAPHTAAQSDNSLMSMLGHMEDLTSIYTEELNAIELRDMKRFADIQSAKNKLVGACEAKMVELKKQPSLLKTASPALKERVAVVENTLSQLAEKSQRECRIRAESLRRVQQRLLDAARHLMARDQSQYNNLGKTSATNTRPVATAINEAI